MRMTLPRPTTSRALLPQRVQFSVSPSPTGIQRKLTVNQPGDRYEQEADRVAEQVMRMPEPSVQRQCTCARGSVGDCEECRKKKTPSTGFLQREATSNSGGSTAPSIVSEVLNSSGSPLPASALTSMEARFGKDFSHVRIHTDYKAANSAAAVQARAYTVGNNIVFGRGEAPARDPRLLAHELTHVVQQSQGAANMAGLQRDAIEPGTSSSDTQQVPIAVSLEFEIGYGPDDTGNSSLPTGLIPGTTAAGGEATLRFLNPIPGTTGTSTANAYTRFLGPESFEEFFSRLRFNTKGEFLPGLEDFGRPDSMRLDAFDIFKEKGISPGQLQTMLKRLRQVGVNGLTSEESSLLRQMTDIHATYTGRATAASPFQSMTELVPGEFAAKNLPNVAKSRAYVLRVRLPPDQVIKINEYLGKLGRGSMAQEAEVLTWQPLTGKGAPGKIISLEANPTGPLGGTRGMIIRGAGTALLVLGAAKTSYDVVTAEGPHKREQQLESFGSFAGGTVAGAFAAGFCVGAGIATGGIALFLCAGIAGIGGALAAGAAGKATGKAWDKAEANQGQGSPRATSSAPRIPSMSQGPKPCPNCHKSIQSNDKAKDELVKKLIREPYGASKEQDQEMLRKWLTGQ